MIKKQLSIEEIKQEGWEDVYVLGYSKVHIIQNIYDKNKKNIMLIHTPVTSIKNCFECYEQLRRLYLFNVFVMDYVPGEGECSGQTKEFTLENMVANLNAVYQYIAENYSNEIHLVGYTGAGAIIAQYYVRLNPAFKSFSQFACGIYGKTTPLGVPTFMAKLVLAISRWIVNRKPDFTIVFNPPKAKGYHAELDNEFYEIMKYFRDADFFNLKLNSLVQILEIMIGKESNLKKEIICPTLVFKTLHDRYFSKEYFDEYYYALTCEKKLVEINDTHNSYFINPEPFMVEIAKWVDNH